MHVAHQQSRKRGPRPGGRGGARPPLGERPAPRASGWAAPSADGGGTEAGRAVGAVGRLERGPRREVRTCVGCGQQGDASAMVRLVLAPAAGEAAGEDQGQTVVVDAKGGKFGRGAHVHPLRACLDRVQKGLSRSFRGRIVVEPAALAEAIQVAYTRRLAGLLGGGVRAGLVAIGTDAVVESLRASSTTLVLVAADASAAAHRGEIAGAIGAGRSLVLWDRARLAAARACRPARRRRRRAERRGLAQRTGRRRRPNCRGSCKEVSAQLPRRAHLKYWRFRSPRAVRPRSQ